MNTEKYDVFISFKHSDANGNKTKDSAIAERLYDFLKENGISVFFSPKELEFLGQSQYSKVIDDALDASRFLVAVGCSKENLDSQWVRYEWDSFVSDIRSGVKPDAEVFVVYAGMSVAELPRALRMRQAFDADDGGSFERLLNFMRNAGLDIVSKRVKAEAEPEGPKDANEQVTLGFNYVIGNGVEKNHEKAVYWFLKAAEQGSMIAQYNLGNSYTLGEGVAADSDKAVYWYRKSAEQGYADAQNNLGICYGHGRGVTADFSQAFYWHKKAAEQGHMKAQCNVGGYYELGLYVKQDISQAVYWYKKSAAQGNAEGQYKLGLCYKDGHGVEADTAKSYEWLKKAAAQGHTKAAEMLSRTIVE
ncbi:MAG: toll/interleukin-1 receptor domain-containing protein [Defluviitaleaceae bacterium]|nr:toll/interleukin-1 receptor domain-containing protein [Defluviitaleaceae bacterium]